MIASDDAEFSNSCNALINSSGSGGSAPFGVMVRSAADVSRGDAIEAGLFEAAFTFVGVTPVDGVVDDPFRLLSSDDRDEVELRDDLVGGATAAAGSEIEKQLKHIDKMANIVNSCCSFIHFHGKYDEI